MGITTQRQHAKALELGTSVIKLKTSYQQDIGLAKIFGPAKADLQNQARKTKRVNTKKGRLSASLFYFYIYKLYNT